jgi:cysteinyl-tRNA synthetase
MDPMHLYDTRTRKKRAFAPQDPNRPTLYVCGPTVYSYAHIGNARPAVVFDVLARLLRRHHDGLVYVRNITDIDDKINAAAAAEGVPISVVATRYTEAYHADLTALGVAAPDIEPRVTDHLPQIRDMIARLIAGGHAYTAEGHVLFHVPSFPAYGELSGRKREDMIAGARVEVAPYKRDPYDFVLWKPSSTGQPGWDSPWGRGRPGWHVECSAMSEAHLGETLDIHGGGSDLIFPHHENENAQSVCAHGGRSFARYWVHNGFVNVNREKMSKSLGNVLLVRDLLEQAPGEAIRFALLSAHYRAPLDWDGDTLVQARRALNRLYQALRDLKDLPAMGEAALPAGFATALEDDLNTPQALAVLFDLAREANRTDDAAERARLKAELLCGGETLGLLQTDPERWFAGERVLLSATEIERLIAERTQARATRDFDRADRIRRQLADQGVVLEDVAGGSRWRVAS